MGLWYTVGVFAGLGTAAGVLVAALVGPLRYGFPLALLLGAVGGAALGVSFGDWTEGAVAGAGGAFGALGGSQLLLGALARGGARLGTTVLLAVGALALGALSFVPVLGYLIAVAVPAVAARLRTRANRTYAGLRILARDD
ncbi:MAG TPA: hypothetical protein VM290_08435 [Gaiellaceae bacterium]|jgi:hypothetical protein|nr:hypothetical protein [Gaiellaceae bacterium]